MPSAPSEVEAFHQFLGQKLQNGGCRWSLDESVAEFRAFQSELARFNDSLRESIEQSRRGEAVPLDVEQLKTEIFEELAQEGITD